MFSVATENRNIPHAMVRSDSDASDWDDCAELGRWTRPCKHVFWARAENVFCACNYSVELRSLPPRSSDDAGGLPLSCCGPQGRRARGSNKFSSVPKQRTLYCWSVTVVSEPPRHKKSSKENQKVGKRRNKFRRTMSAPTSSATAGLAGKLSENTLRAAGRSMRSPPVHLRLSVSSNGMVAAALHVGSKASAASTVLAVTAAVALTRQPRGGTTKTDLASDRHAQRLIAAREAKQSTREEPKLPPSKYVPALKPHMELPSAESTASQLLFVHFIPPSLRKAGKEKVPWIVHGTAAPVVCREATHVHFRGVKGFETYEGAAPEQVCPCMVAQHHLRGTGRLRWNDGVAIIESESVASRTCAETQTEPPTPSHDVHTQACILCVDSDAQTDGKVPEVPCVDSDAQTGDKLPALPEVPEAPPEVKAALLQHMESKRNERKLVEAAALVASLQARVAELEAEAEAARSKPIKSAPLSPALAASVTGASPGAATARSAKPPKTLQATRRTKGATGGGTGSATDRATGLSSPRNRTTATAMPRSALAAERAGVARRAGHEPIAASAWAAG